LTSLDLRHNNLRSIPTTISNLQNLQILRLTENNIDTIIDQIFQLSDLEILSLNNVTKISNQISKLTNLKQLYCHHNKMSDIGNITTLVNLFTLEIYHNNLTTFSKELYGLTNHYKQLYKKIVI